MRYRVIFAPAAVEQLLSIESYIAEKTSATIAERFVNGIISCCEGLANFPQRGIKRDDVRPGLRITNYRKRVAVAFVVEEDAVSILGIFYGGQQYELRLADANDVPR